jgi:hypothetical protein
LYPQPLAGYRQQEVLYDKIETGSPFSVLRSPFSVLRSPFSVSSLVLVLIILSGLVACGGGDGSGMDNFGSVTFAHLPSNYEVTASHISSNPAVQWEFRNGNMWNPSTDAYYSSVIGMGGRRSYSDGSRDPYNKTTLNEGGYTKVGNEWSPAAAGGDFIFSGTASVWAAFKQNDAPPPNNNVFIGFNNVNFSGGHAVIDFTAFDIPETLGKFTLTGVPQEHRGKYAVLVGGYTLEGRTTALYGLKDATSVSAFKGFKIPENGTAAIPVFKWSTGDRNFSSFTESPQNTALVIIIRGNEDFDFLKYTSDLTAVPPVIYPHLVYAGVDFDNGTASKAFGDGAKAGGLE